MPRFESRTSRIRSRNTVNLTAMFSEKQRTKLNDMHKNVLDFHHHFHVLQFSSIRDQLCVIFSLYTVCPTRYRTRLAGGPLLRVATIRCTTDTFLFISHTTNVLLLKFRCNIFIGVRIIKEMPGSLASGTHCIS